MKILIITLLLLAKIGYCIASKDSLYLKKRRKFVRSAIIGMGIGAFGVFTYQHFDQPLQKFSQDKQSKLSNLIFRSAEPFGRAEVTIPVCGGLYLAGFLSQDTRLAKAGAAGLTALLLNDFLTTRLKYAFERHRPNTGSPYNTFDGPHGEDLNTSLPSGHTSCAFATATAIASAFKDKKWIGITAYSLASLVGLSRIYTDHHWASDVLAGAAVGFLCGKLSIAGWNWLEKKNISIVPSLGRNNGNISLTYRF